MVEVWDVHRVRVGISSIRPLKPTSSLSVETRRSGALSTKGPE
jgi:hypothetical protein